MVRIYMRKYFVAVTACCVALGIASLNAAEQKEGLFSRLFGRSKTKAAAQKTIAPKTAAQKVTVSKVNVAKTDTPKTDTSKIDQSNIHEILDSKLTASVERISKQVHDVVASLEKKIDQLHKQSEPNNNVQKVVAKLEKKIDRFKKTEPSNKEQKRSEKLAQIRAQELAQLRAQELAQKRLIDERINKEVTRQVSSLK